MDDMEKIYQEHARTVYKFLLAQTHDPDAAEELTQETFCEAVRSIGRYDGSCKISVWLCQIAKHLWYHRLRRQNKELPSDDSAFELPVSSAEEEAIGAIRRTELLKQIHAMKEPVREVLYLRAFGGLSFREIGDVMGRSENWARVTFYRGKETLKGGFNHEP